MALIQADFKSNALQRRVRINVVLPVDKDAHESWPDRQGKPFKTLYLLHGIYGNANSWLTNSNVVRYAEEKNLCVIMPDGENGFYIDHPHYYNNFSTYVGKELVTLTRQMFPLSAKREDTYIGGFSMGGYGALRTGLLYPETFGIICGLSNGLILDSYVNGKRSGPTSDEYMKAIFREPDLLNSDLNPIWLVRQLLDRNVNIPEIYLSCGEQDFLLADNQKFDHELTALGVPHTFMTSEGRHDWDFWDKELKFLIRNWLPTEDVTRIASEEIH
ncbi:MAG: acetylesterase [Clostridia bacterium]|nr:acetylesterase [Clostridia bacterium]